MKSADPAGQAKLRILIVTQYFWPENFQINHIVRALIERGHRVTVLTGKPNYPLGDFYEGYSMFGRSLDSFEGCKVVRVPLVARGSASGFRLALNYPSFLVTASLLGPRRVRDPFDCIFVYAPSPVIVGIPAIAVRGRRNIPIVYWMQDLWPESIEIASGIRSPILIGLLRRTIGLMLRRCERVLIQSRAFRIHARQFGVDDQRIIYWPQSADRIFQPAPPSDEVPDAFRSKDFRIMFAGNIANAQDFETVVKAADLLRDEEVRWIIVGDGRRREWVIEEVQRRGLEQRVFLPGRFPEQTMPGLFAHADALLVTLAKEPIFSWTIPTKVQAYLASGKPIVAALDGEGARIIEDANAGVVAPAGDAAALASAVMKLASMSPSARAELGANGLDYSRCNFDRDMLVDQLVGVFREAVQERR